MIRFSDLELRLAALLHPHRNRRTAGRRLALVMGIAAAVVLVPLAAWRAPAQTGSALRGVVRDPSGATVPQAKVSVGQAGTDRQEVAVTNDVGEFSVAPLPDGLYRVSVAKPGFALLEYGDVAVSASAAPMEIVLPLGRVRESVSVSATRMSPPPVRAAAAGSPSRIRVGGNVQAVRLLQSTPPAYPADCRAEGVEGAVLLRAVISRTGDLLNISPVNQLVDRRLVDAAMEAVRQWRYQPTLLNGEPVEVITEIQINFALTQ